MFVKPSSPTLKVRGPDRRLLAAEGQEVPEVQFWHRRLMHGDVVLADAPVVLAEAPVAESPVAVEGVQA